jgi:tetratricopeptide (TPR) repeat protein
MTAKTTLQELEMAVQRHEQFLRVDPGNVLLQQTLGELYHQAGRFDDAISCFERCLAIDASNSKARSRLGSVLISQHRFDEAERQLRALVDTGDHDPALLHNLGLTLYFQHRFEDAAKLFAEAATGGLAAATNFAYLARSFHHLGQMTDAIAAGERWMRLAPGVDSQSYLALLHMDDGNTEAGRLLAMDVLLQDPDNVDANVVVGSSMVERQESQQARKCFETALRLDVDNGRAWLGLGLVCLYEKQHESAIDALQNAVRIHPDNAGMIVTLGWAKLTNKDPTGAQQIFEQALNVDRTFAESHAGLAASLALQMKLDRAQEEIDLARRLARNSIGAEIATSFVEAARGNRQAATDAFARALQRSPAEGLPPLIEHLKIYSNKQIAKGSVGKPARSGAKPPTKH